jgi:hypothetical protein
MIRLDMPVLVDLAHVFISFFKSKTVISTHNFARKTFRLPGLVLMRSRLPLTSSNLFSNFLISEMRMLKVLLLHVVIMTSWIEALLDVK